MNSNLSKKTEETNYESEAERFNLIANYLDEFSAIIDTISNEEIKSKSKTYLSRIENLVLQSPEWIYGDGLRGINMGVFGAIESGWKQVLQVFVDNNEQDYIEDMGIRVKHVIKLSDSSKHLLLIRHESDTVPDADFSNWADCGLFVFRLDSERCYKDAVLSHKELVSLRKASRRYAPMILVGCAGGTASDPARARLKSFVELKHISQQCGFDDYFEIRCDTGWNLFYLFEYCTKLTYRCKYFGYVPPKLISTNFDFVDCVMRSGARTRQTQKRKTCIEDDFKMPMGSISSKKSTKNEKRTSSITETTNETERRQSFTLFKTKNKSLPRPSTNETSSSCSSDGSVVEQRYSSLNRRYVSMIQLPEKKSKWRFFHRKKGNSSKGIAPTADNILIQGFLYKGRNKKWVTITKDAKMYYHKSKQDCDKGVSPKYIDLKNTSAKVPGNNCQNGYVLRAAKNGKKKINDEEDPIIKLDTHNEKGQLVSRIYRASSTEERDNWMDKIRDAIFIQYSEQKLDRKYESVFIGDSVDDALIKIRKIYGNDICAECCAKNPTWVVYNFGILVCDRCSGAHRNLGVEISKVCSLKLDLLDKIKISILYSFGNTIVNSVMEAKLHLTDDIKPTPDTPLVDDWLNKKYVLKKYIPPLPLPHEAIHKQLIFAIQENDSRYQLICLMNAVKGQLNLPYDENDGRTALMIAARLANIVAVQLLLWAGVDPSIKDQNGLNAHGFVSINLNGEPLSPEATEIQDLLRKFNTPPQFCKLTQLLSEPSPPGSTGTTL